MSVTKSFVRLFVAFLLGFIFIDQAVSVCGKRIVPLGDSITKGSSSGVTDPGYMVGYRKYLWDLLQSSGYLIDFVGSFSSGYQIAGFDSHHEAAGGISAATVKAFIYDKLVEFQPHIVLMHLGTNDGTASTRNIGLILDEVDRYENNSGNPVTVIVARIIQQNPLNNTVTAFNLNLATLIATRKLAGDDVRLVDMEAALTYPDDLFNQLHPLATGYEKMANVWKTELDTLLATCTDTVAPERPTGLTGSVPLTNRIQLSWGASVDVGSGIAGYTVYRNGAKIAQRVGNTYIDTSVLPGTSYTYYVEAYDFAGNISSASALFSVTTPLVDLTLRINSGGNDYVDTNGNLWLADYGYNGGRVTATSKAIGGTADAGLYQTGRFDVAGGAELIYSIGMSSGRYNVILHLAETYSGTLANGARVFDVAMEGNVVLADIDIFAEAGPNTALTKGVTLDVVDGTLDIEFLHKVENPAVRGIEIIRLGDAIPDKQAPSAPTGVTGTVNGTSQISLNWVAVSDDVGVAGYRIFRDGVEVESRVSTRYTDTGLSAAMRYEYTVSAYDYAGNNSVPSAAVSLTTAAVTTRWRINVGGATYIDSSGYIWAADYGYNGGRVTATTEAIGGPRTRACTRPGALTWPAGSR